ncbi:MAG: hypothetical protein H6623_08760 [Bdellovibrionaceae bacterium]|nr:hypothetical protein [Pseudobdellovibrionaceae bacterium]
MAEFKFVLKAVVITFILIIALQFDIKGRKGEDYLVQYMKQGKIVVWIRQATQGAIQLAENGMNALRANTTIQNYLPRQKTMQPLSHEEDFPDEMVSNENL